VRAPCGIKTASLLAEALFLLFADGRKEPLLAGKKTAIVELFMFINFVFLVFCLFALAD